MKLWIAVLITVFCVAARAADEPRSEAEAKSLETFKKEIAEYRKQLAEYSEKLKPMSDAEIIALRKTEKDALKKRLLFSALKGRIVLGISQSDARNLLDAPTSTTGNVDFYDETIRGPGPSITQGIRVHFENDKVILVEPVTSIEKTNQQNCER